jgi:hypothetical protein
MKSKLFWGLIAGAVLMMGTSSAVSAKSDGPGDAGYTEVNKEFYLTEAEIAFIRPGLVFEVIEIVIPSDRQPELTFKITDPGGLPLDLDGVYTPGPVSNLFTLAYIPVGEAAYIAYTTQVASSDITGESVIQASYDHGGVYTEIGEGDGVYLYKFATVLPEDYPMDATTSLGVQSRRNLDEWDLGQYVVNELEHFIPSGMGTPDPRDVTTTETCNRCHDPLSLHGGWRTEVGVCVLCHNPTQGIDPDTMDSVDMPYMTHKIHAGAHLENGYTIIGYRGSVHDYSHVEFPIALTECESCHTGGTPTADMPMLAEPNPAPACDANGLSMTEVIWGAEGNIDIHVDSADGSLFASAGDAGSQWTGKWVNQGQQFFLVDAANGDVLHQTTVHNSVFGCANNPPGTMRGEPGEQHTDWMTEPSRMACGSCHDELDFFTSGENHPVQEDDSKCGFCHQPNSGEEFDISVTGAHTTPYKSTQLPGVLVQILDVQNTDPGDRPRVTFSLSTKYGPMSPADMNRLRFTLSGPNTDFTFYAQDDALGKLIPNGGNWVFNFESRLPTDAVGSFAIGVEGRAGRVINPGEPDEFSMNDQMQNFIEPIAVTDTAPMSRREVVSDAKCESCHSNLSLHGSNRHDANGYCQTCHMPSATDEAVRPDGTGEPQSIDFRYMIHKIHRGADLENGYVVYGYRSSLHDFSEVEFVGDLRNCEACHDDGTYQLPLPSGLEAVTTPQALWSPMLPETASCLSCHDSDAAAVHADSNSTDLGEACSACHGVGKTYSVDAVHAR